MKDYFKGLVLPAVTVLMALAVFFGYKMVDSYDRQTTAIIQALNGNCKVALEREGWKVTPPVPSKIEEEK